jgi:citrate synthase
LAPNVKFSLATLVQALSFPETSPFTIFAIGRSARRLAHAQEQYPLPELTRPWARYVGDKPQIVVSRPIP